MIVTFQFECCGVNDYTDFEEAEKWEREQTVQLNYGGFEYNGTVTYVAPAACCKNNGTFPTNIIPYDANCTFAPTNDNSNWNVVS